MTAFLFAILLEQSEPGVRELIDSLRSEDAQERDRAMAGLEALGERAARELEQAAADPDAEVADRARQLLRGIEIRRKLPEKLRLANPKAAEELAKGEFGIWMRTFAAALELSVPSESLEWLGLEMLGQARQPQEKAQAIETLGTAGIKSAAPEITKALSDPDLRKAAIGALDRLEARESLARIVELLHDPDLGVANAAARALVSLDARDHLPVIFQALKSPQAETRARAAYVLEQLSAPGIERELVPMLRDPDPAIREMAAMHLGYRGYVDKNTALELVRLLEDPSEQVGSKAEQSLIWLEPREAGPAVARILGNSDPRIRSYAASVLGASGAHEFAGAIRGLVKDPHPRARWAAVGALIRLGAVDTPELVGFLEDPYSEIRKLAIRELENRKARETAPEIVKWMQDPDFWIRQDVAYLMVRWGAREVAPEIAKLLGDPDVEIRRSAAYTLGSLKATETAPELGKLLGDPAPIVRAEALSALARLGAKEFLPTIRNLLRDPDKMIQASALKAAASLGSQECAADALRFLDDPDPGLRSAAAQALASLKARAEAPRIAGLLKDPDSQVRDAAASALVGLEARGMANEIAALLNEPSNRSTAARALARLEAKEYAAEIAKWARQKTKSCVFDSTLEALVELGATSDLVGLLSAGNEAIRRESLMALWRLGAAETVQEIAALLKDRDPSVRWTAALVLAEFGAKKFEPAIRDLLRDPRAGSPLALARLGSKESIPDIAALLDDPRMRGGAAMALGELEAIQTAPRLVEMLQNGKRSESRSAVWALGEIGAKDTIPDIVRLLKDPQLRGPAARSLCMLGSTEGVSTLLESRQELNPLNALRNPKVWSRLRALSLGHERVRGSRREILEKVGKLSGLRIECPEWEDGQGWRWPEHGRRLTDTLEQLTRGRWAFILEEDRIRIVDFDEALRFWKEWWDKSKR
jgi:HEAT repeat protein